MEHISISVVSAPVTILGLDDEHRITKIFPFEVPVDQANKYGTFRFTKSITLTVETESLTVVLWCKCVLMTPDLILRAKQLLMESPCNEVYMSHSLKSNSVFR